jgi:hypothetical protein
MHRVPVSRHARELRLELFIKREGILGVGGHR